MGMNYACAFDIMNVLRREMGKSDFKDQNKHRLNFKQILEVVAYDMADVFLCQSISVIFHAK